MVPGPVVPMDAVGSRLLGVSKQAVLEREQADGGHLVGFRPGKLVVEASEHPGVHQRLTFASHALLRSMERDGWQIVGVWGPWTYLKRPSRSSSS